jgi:hypothetical protein
MMQSEDGFRDVLNSIQSLNVASKTSEDEQLSKTTTNIRYSDSGFSSTGGSDVNGDNIFFYEDSCPSLSSCLDITNNFNIHDNDKTITASSSSCYNNDRRMPSPNFHQQQHLQDQEQQQRSNNNFDQEMTQIKVNVGIDEDLKMILEMDPSLMDETLDKAFEPSSVNVVDCPKVIGLPPKM